MTCNKPHRNLLAFNLWVQCVGGDSGWGLRPLVDVIVLRWWISLPGWFLNLIFSAIKLHCSSWKYLNIQFGWERLHQICWASYLDGFSLFLDCWKCPKEVSKWVFSSNLYPPFLSSKLSVGFHSTVRPPTVIQESRPKNQSTICSLNTPSAASFLSSLHNVILRYCQLGMYSVFCVRL